MEKALLENVIHPDSMYSFAYFPTYSHHLSKLDLESLWYAKAAHLSYHHYYNNLISILFQSNFTYLVFETNFVRLSSFENPYFKIYQNSLSSKQSIS